MTETEAPQGPVKLRKSGSDQSSSSKSSNKGSRGRAARPLALLPVTEAKGDEDVEEAAATGEDGREAAGLESAALEYMQAIMGESAGREFMSDGTKGVLSAEAEMDAAVNFLEALWSINDEVCHLRCLGEAEFLLNRRSDRCCRKAPAYSRTLSLTALP